MLQSPEVTVWCDISLAGIIELNISEDEYGWKYLRMQLGTDICWNSSFALKMRFNYAMSFQKNDDTSHTAR
jgi:hypothetical protein